MNKIDVLIVGAGLTGLIAARTLMDKGHKVLLIDKAKSVGGRMATRRMGSGKVDHGAQFFTVRSEQFQSEVDQWLKQGYIKPWFGENHPRYMSPGGMNALAKALATDLPVQLKTEIKKIAQVTDGYRLHSTTGEIFKAKAVILTIPAPQADELLERSHVELNKTAVEQLKTITFNPCLVGLFTLSTSPELPETGHLDQALPQGMMRIVDHHKKAISDTITVSVYMTGQWSKDYVDEADGVVLNKIIQLSHDYFSKETVVASQLKKWRYAEAIQILREPYLELSNKPPLMIAGDAFLSNEDAATHARLESAFISGESVAGHLSYLMRDK